MTFKALDGGCVRADEEFISALASLGLDTVAGAFAYSGEGFLRTHANRDNFHVVATLDGRVYDLFMKRHRAFEIREALKLLMARSPLRSAGRREWENILRMGPLGIPTMRPVAVGEKKWLFIERRSFLITERIPDAVPMDDFLRERCGGAASLGALRAKRALLWDVGSLVRRLHGAGLTHMDLYLNHVFVRETPSGDRVLHLIDLQRVAKRWLFRRRWIVKDLAALLYSTRALPLSRTDVARMMAAYFDGRLDAAGRRLLQRAMARAEEMAARNSA
jgi:hypothetical protein